MKAKTIKGKSTEEIYSALQQTLIAGGHEYKPTLAIVFMSFKLDIDALCDVLHREGIQIFGSTTHGEFISSQIEEETIVIMLLDINTAYFKLTYSEKGELSEYEIAKLLGRQGKSTFPNAAFVIATGWSNEMDGEEIIRGIEDGFENETLIFGGMAGDDQTMTGPKIFTYGKSSRKGLVAIIIDQDKIDISGIATCGWKAIGITKTITKSKGNIVYTIDDKPALDLVMQYLGLSQDEELMKNMVLNLGGYYPLQLEREGAPSVMRTAMQGNAEDRSLVYAGNVPQGAKVCFSLPPILM